MHSNLKQVRQEIGTLLSTLVGTGKPFDYIYDYHTVKAEGYPYVSYEPKGLLQEIEDTTENRRVYNFDLYIYQEIKTISRGQGMTILVDCIDSVTSLFDENYTLGDTVIQVKPTVADIDSAILEQNEVLFCYIQLSVEVLKTV